jgi:hypothetical protein
MHGCGRRFFAAFVAAGCVTTGASASALGSPWMHDRGGGTVRVMVRGADGPADLYPGFDHGDLWFVLDNPGRNAVTFTSMVPGRITSSDPVSCPASVITVAPVSGLELVVAPRSKTQRLHIADVVAMSRDAPDGCQGVAFGIQVVLDGVRAA